MRTNAKANTSNLIIYCLLYAYNYLPSLESALTAMAILLSAVFAYSKHMLYIR